MKVEIASIFHAGMCERHTCCNFLVYDLRGMRTRIVRTEYWCICVCVFYMIYKMLSSYILLCPFVLIISWCEALRDSRGSSRCWIIVWFPNVRTSYFHIFMGMLFASTPNGRARFSKALNPESQWVCFLHTHCASPWPETRGKTQPPLPKGFESVRLYQGRFRAFRKVLGIFYLLYILLRVINQHVCVLLCVCLFVRVLFACVPSVIVKRLLDVAYYV